MLFQTVEAGRRAILLGVLGALTPSTVIQNAGKADPLCDPCVSQLRDASGKEVTLVGTAHVAERSVDLVRSVVRHVRPDEVMVELDAARLAELLKPQDQMPQSPADLGVPLSVLAAVVCRFLVFDLEGARDLLLRIWLSSSFRDLTRLGLRSGEEFVAAIEEAKRCNATVLLGDQDADLTITSLRRAIDKLIANPPAGGIKDPPQYLLDALGDSDEKVTLESLQRTTDALLRQREVSRQLAAYLRNEVPPIYESLVAERDAILATSLLHSSKKRIVAVVGLIHLEGIESILTDASFRLRAPPITCAVSRAQT